MEKFAFKMQLNEGQAEAYQQRHDEIWPELVTLLKDAGIEDYSIHLDEDTHLLFGVLWRRTDHKMDELPNSEIMQKWWAYMADLMETNAENEPISTPLKTVFHMM